MREALRNILKFIFVLVNELCDAFCLSEMRPNQKPGQWVCHKRVTDYPFLHPSKIIYDSTNSIGFVSQASAKLVIRNLLAKKMPIPKAKIRNLTDMF
jgi:hypothetical protein